MKAITTTTDRILRLLSGLLCASVSGSVSGCVLVAAVALAPPSLGAADAPLNTASQNTASQTTAPIGSVVNAAAEAPAAPGDPSKPSEAPQSETEAERILSDLRGDTPAAEDGAPGAAGNATAGSAQTFIPPTTPAYSQGASTRMDLWSPAWSGGVSTGAELLDGTASGVQPPAEKPPLRRLETRENSWPNGKLKTRWTVYLNTEAQPVRHGVFLRSHANGQPAVKGAYRDNQPVGVWSWWDEQGALVRQVRQMGDHEEVIKGQGLDSPNTVFRMPDGRKISEGLIKDGRAHGLWVYYYQQGARKAEGHFVRGVPDSRWTYFYISGQVEQQQTYHMGVLHGPYMQGFDNGQEREAGRMDQGLRVGRWRTWFKNGQLQSEGNYREDQREGEWRFWDNRGTLVRHARYRRGDVDEEIPLPQPKLDGPKVITNPRALPHRPRVYDEAGSLIKMQDR